MLRILNRVCRPGNVATMRSLQEKWKRLLEEISDADAPLYIKCLLYTHQLAVHAADEMEAVFPYSLIHLASASLEATNRITHSNTAHVRACGGISHNEQLPCVFQQVFTHLKLHRQLLKLKLEKVLSRPHIACLPFHWRIIQAAEELLEELT